MTTKTFTLLSVNIFKQASIFAMCNMVLIIGTKYSYQIKVITTMMKNYNESVKINHNPNWSDIPDHPIES